MGIFDRLRGKARGQPAEPPPFVLTDLEKLTPDQFDELRTERGLPEAVLRSYLELLGL